MNQVRGGTGMQVVACCEYRFSFRPFSVLLTALPRFSWRKG